MNSINDALAYHWPYPLKHKKPAALKKQTAYRLGVKLPNELDLEIKAFSKGSGHQKAFPRSTLNHKVTESRSIIDSFNSHSSLKHRHGGRALGAVPAHNTDSTTRKSSKQTLLSAQAVAITSCLELEDTAASNSLENCQLTLAKLTSMTITTSKATAATRLTHCDRLEFRMSTSLSVTMYSLIVQTFAP